MECDKLKNRISALFKVIVEGDLNLRMNYLARLIDHMQIFVDQKAMQGTVTPEIKEEIVRLEQARESYNDALDTWSKYLANNPAGLAKATMHSDVAIRYITKIIEDNNINTASTWQFQHKAKTTEPGQTTGDQLPGDLFSGDA